MAEKLRVKTWESVTLALTRINIKVLFKAIIDTFFFLQISSNNLGVNVIY